MMPGQFERLQPQEFEAILAGYKWRKEDDENLKAYFVCQIMNLMGKYLKEPITVTELLRPLREDPEQKRKDDEAYIKETFKEILEAQK